ncbi:hypothetical protein GCM10011507_32400 [Edaphobacter acidisoli]|uniref:Uncharacterized protein n=1 Tax=Edaphobacter acidisoli TaxID=2040573 RepID=A0A916W9R9_9BACT|nr:hypothetical protein GCM10011507_32400 [Edaphobacter acidisoli]
MEAAAGCGGAARCGCCDVACGLTRRWHWQGYIPGAEAPGFFVAGVARTEVRAYLRGNNNCNNNCNSNCNDNCNCKGNDNCNCDLP